MGESEVHEGGEVNGAASAPAATEAGSSTQPLSDDEVERTLPPRYIRGCMGDRTEALRRWRATLEWRKDYGTDELLKEPQLHYDVLKRVFPIYLYGRDKNGHVALYEQIGKVNTAVLDEEGLSVQDLLRHYAFVTECLWREVEPDDDAQLVTIEDVANVRLWHLTPRILRFVREAAAIMREHHVERCYRSYIVNAPLPFRAVWSVVQHFFDARTKEKVRIIGYDHSALLEDFDASALPVEYGGTCERAMDDSDEERKVREIVQRSLKS